jgi:hypothetical protein
MTRNQVAKSLGVDKTYVDDAYKLAYEEYPELKKEKDADYTLEEIILALSYLRHGKGLTILEKTLLEEDFTMRKVEPAKAIGIDGTDEFLNKLKHNHKKKCCATCAYCTKSTMKNSKPILYPYCLYHERYIHLFNRRQKHRVDVYNDYCFAWEYSNKEPLIFYKGNSPTNLDIYGNVKNEVMGFDVKEFGKKSESGLITDIGMEIPDIED